MKEDVFHTKWLENPRAQELIEAFARDDLHNTAECVEAGSGAIAPAASGLEIQGRRAQTRDVVGKLLSWFSGDLGRLGSACRPTAHQPRHVRKQIANGDLASCRNGVKLRRRIL